MRSLATALRTRAAAELLGVLALRRIAGAGYPIILIVATADVRGFPAAALVQACRVAALAGTAPFRARLLDRIGRARIIKPQILLTSLALIALTVCSLTRSVPIWAAAAAAVVMALTSPSLEAVIRTVWRTIGRDQAQIKALHSFDSILEEAGFLAGPVLASVLMLGLGPRPALYAATGAVIAGHLAALLPAELRTAIHRQPASKPAQPAEQDRGVAIRLRRAARTAAGPIATPELQRIVTPLILMGLELGIIGILAPALSARHGNASLSGFVIGCISAGGIAGALTYGALNLQTSLRRQHALLGLLFGVPLLPGLWAHSPWQLGLLLALAGLAVTPLYINAYLMMDADIPPTAIHEANTWVPVGNDVGYLTGLAVAGWFSRHANLHAISTSLTAAAALLVAYSLLQLRTTTSTEPATVGAQLGQTVA